jgi:hypothetical protein
MLSKDCAGQQPLADLGLQGLGSPEPRSDLLASS